MKIEGFGYLAVLAVTALLSLVLTPMAMRSALRWKALDRPSAIKAQAAPVPYLGGVAIVVSFALAVLGASVVRQPDSGLDELAIIIGLALALAVMGLIDDLRGLSPLLRLAVEIAAGVVLWATPAGAELFDADLANLVVTVGWTVAVTNAFNLLDNMDGLSSGVAAIAALFLFSLAAQNGQFLVATLAIGLAGCALGFLRSNFHPARIYMGDAGALFLGFLLAVVALKIDLEDAPQNVALGLPIVVLGVPLFDTALVVVNRLAHRRSPMVGGRDHTSHRLVFVGIPVPVAVGLIYFGAASLGWLGLVISELDVGDAFLLYGWIASVALLLFTLLSLVPVYDSSTRRHLMIQEVSQREHEPLAGPGTPSPAVTGEPESRFHLRDDPA
jgi:UDP-GlcNAc:undecaprenyl-phosphate GlcNAc-1-phosphate transferase